jgi:hypothetical protein
MTERFVTQLPQTSGHVGLGTPYDHGLYTVQQLEKLLQHQPGVWKNYADFMQELANSEALTWHIICPLEFGTLAYALRNLNFDVNPPNVIIDTSWVYNENFLF